MSSKRALRRKACEGKDRYPDMATASRYAKEACKRAHSWIVPYKCQFCDSYHIGHATPATKKSIRARRNYA